MRYFKWHPFEEYFDNVVIKGVRRCSARYRRRIRRFKTHICIHGVNKASVVAVD